MNVLLVVIDCLRADHVGAYGYSRPTTPYLDALAAEGIRFDSAYANGTWTKPSITVHSIGSGDPHGYVTTEYAVRRLASGRITGRWGRLESNDSFVRVGTLFAPRVIGRDYEVVRARD